MSSLAEEVASLSEQLIEYQHAVSDVVEALGHRGDSPDDLRDAVAQITDRLLCGRDLDATTLTGTAEVIRTMLAYAHIGAWFVRGMTQAPIVPRVASPNLLAVFNAGPPSWEACRSLVVVPENFTEREAQAWLADWFTLFDGLGKDAE